MNINKENIIDFFQNVIDICKRTTSGNISHQMSAVIGSCIHVADKVKEQHGEIMAYSNLMHVVELASKVTTGNISHMIPTIEGLCYRNIEFIKKYGLIDYGEGSDS